jgi:hypothetical protein
MVNLKQQNSSGGIKLISYYQFLTSNKKAHPHNGQALLLRFEG